MKIHLLSAVILAVVLCFTPDLNAQTTVYYSWPSTQLPTGPDAPFNMRKVLTAWTYSEAGSTATDKRYVETWPTSQPGVQPPHAFVLNVNMEYLVLEVGNMGYDRVTRGMFKVNEDKNIRVEKYDGKVLLILTDQMMKGILTVRDITGQ